MSVVSVSPTTRTTMENKNIVIFLIVAVLSQVNSNRLSQHAFFKLRNNITTTASPQSKVVTVGDKTNGPPVVSPSPVNSILDQLMNRQNYFDNMKSGAKNNSGSNSNNNNIVTPQQTIQVSTTTLDTVPTDTTTKPTLTTKTATTNRNNQIFNEDGTLNRNRPVMLPFPRQQPTDIADRQNQVSFINQWFQRFNRPPFTSRDNPRSRSNNPEPVEPNDQNGNANGTSVSSTPAPIKNNSSRSNGVVEVGPYGGVYIVNDKPTAAPSNSVPDNDKQGPTHVDVQDKPFYGINPGDFNSDKSSSDSGTDFNTQNLTYSYQNNGRHKRASNTDSTVVNGTSCYEPQRFEPCQYYNQCLSSLVEKCKTSGICVGEEANRFCTKTLEKNLPVQSSLLSRYFRSVEECVRDRLSLIIESPTSDDLTKTLSNALLVTGKTSCFYQELTFCNITEDVVARDGLTTILKLPTSDVDFMSRLMINIAKLTSFCRGHGASHMVTDIVKLATATDSPYKDKFSKTPIPGLEQSM